MCVPLTLRPLSAAVKFATAEVIIGEVGERVASVTDRAFEFSMKNDVPAGIGAMVGALSATEHAPEIDVTKLRAARPGVLLEIVRFTKLAVDVQSLAVNVDAPAAIAAVLVIKRAAPLWYTAL